MEILKIGWHTSYYLPTEKIQNLLVNDRHEDLELLALKICDQAEHQRLSAISFDGVLYPFVKKYLEPLLHENIVYHTVDLSVDLYDINLVTSLSRKITLAMQGSEPS